MWERDGRVGLERQKDIKGPIGNNRKGDKKQRFDIVVVHEARSRWKKFA